MSAILVCVSRRSYVFFYPVHPLITSANLFVFKATSDPKKRRMKIRPIKTDKI